MDGKTVARMRLLGRTATELRTQNTYLSDQLLRMSEAVDRAAKQSHVDRLLSAVLVRRFGVASRVVVPIEDVEALRREMATPPGLSLTTSKDTERGVWIVELAAAVATDAAPDPPERPSLVLHTSSPTSGIADGA